MEDEEIEQWLAEATEDGKWSPETLEALTSSLNTFGLTVEEASHNIVAARQAMERQQEAQAAAMRRQLEDLRDAMAVQERQSHHDRHSDHAHISGLGQYIEQPFKPGGPVAQPKVDLTPFALEMEIIEFDCCMAPEQQVERHRDDVGAYVELSCAHCGLDIKLGFPA